ncbi:MAG TPA: 2-oxoacid:acceptor oxidoreductase subunit alpha, partial [Myxococcaceae bacterium]|nr:2-oxoacid:acceptor oxidoreductase subunit alpha [Myxococcaceae bacterium]
GGFERYRDVDGDGIGYRTLPGTDHPAAAYFTRGTGHNEKAQYSERPDDWVNNLDRLERKMDTARRELPPPILDGTGAEVGIIGYGSSHHALVESRDQLAKEKGLRTDYLRLLAYPFSPEVQAFIERHPRVYVVEQNRDGQLASLLKLELPAELTTRLRPVAHIPGLPLDARSVTDEIAAREGR